MHPGGEVASLHYLGPANPTMYNQSHDFYMPENNHPSTTFHFRRYFGGQSMLQDLELHHHTSLITTPCVSNNNSATTSDEADEHQLSLVDERKRRRMISNRESARRSRMRKQKHLDELWSQVLHLRAINRRLIDELNRVIGDRDRILHENTKFRDKLIHLQQMLKNLQMERGDDAVLKDLQQVPCNTSPRPTTVLPSTN